MVREEIFIKFILNFFDANIYSLDKNLYLILFLV